MPDHDRDQFRRLLLSLRGRTMPTRRIQALLLLADGVSAGVIARRLQTAPSSINRWRALYEAKGLVAFL